MSGRSILGVTVNTVYINSILAVKKTRTYLARGVLAIRQVDISNIKLSLTVNLNS